MNAPLNPNVLAVQANAAATKESIRAYLISELAEWSIDPDQVYINSVTDPVEQLVIGSTSLTTEAWHRVYENSIPNYSTQTAGLFTVAYSYANEHRLPAPDLLKVGQIIAALVQKLG